MRIPEAWLVSSPNQHPSCILAPPPQKTVFIFEGACFAFNLDIAACLEFKHKEKGNVSDKFKKRMPLKRFTATRY